MKRILSFILVAILCLGVLTGCEQVGGILDNVTGTVGGWLGLGGNETVGPTVDNAMTVLHNIMKEKNPITRDDYDVVAQVVAASDDGTKGTFKVTWTVDDDAIVIRESTKTGFYTVDLPDANEEEFTYTLTATISDDAGNKASKSYTFTFPVINNTGITSEPVEGVAYKIFLLQGSFQQRYYALATTQNNENKFINTDLDPVKAADFFVEKVDGGYKFYTDVDGVKTYVYAKTTKDESTGKISKYIGFSTEEGSVFSYNEAKGGVWTVKIDGLVYGVGTYGTYTTISLSDESYFTPEKVGDSQFVIKFITSEYANTLGPDKEPEKEDDAKAILEKLYGLADGESATGSFTLTGKITALDSYNNPTIVVAGYENMPVYCYKLADDRFEIGATITVTALSMKNYGGTYEFMSCTLDKFTAAGGSETPAGDLGVIAAPEVGTAYKFGLNHGGKGNIDVFFNGENYNNYAWYLAFTDNSAEAVDVYLENVEGVEGGLRLFFYNGDAKTYIVAFPRDGDTTKGTLKLDTAVPETYYTYSAEHKTLIYTSVTGEQFYLGSSGTYGSISCSAISYITSSTSYIAHFYGEGGENSGNGGTDTPVDPQPPVDEMTAKEILDALYALQDNESLEGPFTLTGKITALDDKKNPTIVVEGFENQPVYCYKLVVDNAVGDIITVTAKSMKNYKGTYEFMNCTLAHDCVYSAATCTAVEICTICGAEKPGSTTLPHTWVDATCTVPKTCSVCGGVEGKPLAHTFVNGVCSCGVSESNKQLFVNIGEYAAANGWTKGVMQNTINANGDITFTATSTNPNVQNGNNTGKFYDSDMTWRIYQADAPLLTISGIEGVTIKFIQIAYVAKNEGTLAIGETFVENYALVAVNANSVTLSVINDGTGTKTNGQALITNIIVYYEGGNETPVQPETPDNNEEAKAILDQLYALADGETANGSFTLTGKITALDDYNNPTIVVEGFENMPVYCYKLKVTNKVGDIISVTATQMKNYKGTYELMNCSLVHDCDYSEATCTSAATCKICGATNGEPAGHNYVDGTCSVCGASNASKTVVVDIAKVADDNNWANSTKYSTFTLDGVTFTAAGTDANTGKYYTNGENWRLYSSGNATLTITAPEGKTITSVTITFSEGGLKYGDVTLTSGTSFVTSGNTVVVSTTAKTFINSITVSYQ